MPDFGNVVFLCEAREFPVNSQAEKFPERDELMASAATQVIAVLPQFGGGPSGALIAVLVNDKQQLLKGPSRTPHEILQLIRENSEPYDAKFAEVQATLYEAWYAPMQSVDLNIVVRTLASALRARHGIIENTRFQYFFSSSLRIQPSS